MKIIKCEDCLANYSEDFYHVCPPWLKALVIMHKKKNAKTGDKLIDNDDEYDRV